MRCKLMLVVALCSAARLACAQIVEQPITGDPVRIDTGRVAGMQLASGVNAYLGLRFAAPLVRELR